MKNVVLATFDSASMYWNGLMHIAVDILLTSPLDAADGTPYRIVKSLYDSIQGATLPIAVTIFIIQILHSVVTSPPEQQVTRFLMDSLRFGIIVAISKNLWVILKAVVEFTDGITGALGSVGGYQVQMSSDLQRIIDESLTLPEFELSGEWIASLFETLGCSAILLIGGITLLFTMVAAGLSIISTAFKRILKPLVMMPFAGIVVALGVGSGEMTRSLYQYIRTFISFALSGAVMIISIKAGSSLCNTLVTGFTGTTNIENCIIMTVQAAITPIVIAGLVRGSENLVSRMF